MAVRECAEGPGSGSIPASGERGRIHPWQPRAPRARPTKNPEFVVSVNGHQATYDFGSLVALFGSKYVALLAAAWADGFVSLGELNTQICYRACIAFHMFLARRAGEFPSGAAASVMGELIAADSPPTLVDFAQAAQTFREAVADPADRTVLDNVTKRTRNNLIASTSTVLRILVGRGLLPEGVRLRSMPRRSNEATTLSLAELGVSDLLAKGDAQGPRGLQDIVDEMARLNRKRLGLIRSAACEQLQKEYEAFRRFDEIMIHSDLPGLEEMKAALAPRGWSGGWFADEVAAVLKNQKPSDVERLRLAVVRYLVLTCDCRFRAVDLPYRLQVVVTAVGGPDAIIRHVEGTGAAMLAAFVIVICDTGFNVAPCSDLPEDPYTGKVRMGRVLIATTEGLKLRAQGKLVEGELLDDVVGGLEVGAEGGGLSGRAALDMWREMSARLRNRARAEGCPFAGKLWLLPVRGCTAAPVDLFSYASIRGMFGRFLRKVRESLWSGAERTTFRMIRTTVHQIAATRNGFDHLAARAIGQQDSDGMTSVYLSSDYIKRAFAALMIEFQDRYEAVSGMSIPDFGKLLGIGEEEAARRLDSAIESGLGTLCAGLTDGVRPGSTRGKPCRTMGCPDCIMLRVAPTPVSFRGAHLMHRALTEARPQWEFRNPQRWVQAWLPWLALTTVIIERFRSGPHRVRFERAACEADADLAAGRAVLPTLYLRTGQCNGVTRLRTGQCNGVTRLWNPQLRAR